MLFNLFFLYFSENSMFLVFSPSPLEKRYLLYICVSNPIFTLRIYKMPNEKQNVCKKKRTGRNQTRLNPEVAADQEPFGKPNDVAISINETLPGDRKV
jgi:hypothetical protein